MDVSSLECCLHGEPVCVGQGTAGEQRLWGRGLLTAAGNRDSLVFKEVWVCAFRSSLDSLLPLSLCLASSAKDRKVWLPGSSHSTSV